MTEKEAREATRLEGNITITGIGRRVEKFLEGLSVAHKALEEIQQYRALGTVEELKEARERQIAKKVIPTPEHDYYTFKCPVCDKHYDWCLRSRYCECGQKIDWSEI